MAATTSSVSRARQTSHASANPPKLQSTRTTSNRQPIGPSNISLFLTNLRLLDLDLLPDWPSITPQTFSAKDANHDQKRRIQSTEWALYHLFALWDPDEARNKLQPFFPPADPVQSLNLRAALLRCLEAAKKQGVMGRDVVLRKTMLDECKGERLEEVLAVFSSAVLRGIVFAQADPTPPLAQAMALEDRGYAGDRSELAALVLVHRASLGRFLEQKRVERAQFADLAELLHLKERSLTRRMEQIEASPSDESEALKGQFQRALRSNWSGNDGWTEALLEGGLGVRSDDLLSTPFDKVWECVQAGRLVELETPTKHLLDQLDDRVKVQRERLQRWQDLRYKLNAGQKATVDQTSSGQDRGIGLRFDAHKTLRRTTIASRKSLSNRAPSGEYATLLRNLEQELQDVERGGAPTELPNQPWHTGAIQDDGFVDDGSLDTTPEEQITSLPQPVPAENESEDEWEDELPVAPTQETPSARSSIPPTPSPLREQSPSGEPTPLPELKTAAIARPSTPSSPPSDPSPVRQMADEVLASMNAISPSPVKRRHVLSLAERTRLSMARGSPQVSSDDEPALLSVRRAPGVALELAEAVETEDDLVERTRRSMAGFEAAQQRAKLDRQRSQRKPRPLASRREEVAYSAVDEEEATAPTRELLSGEQDYDTIFMSRPKIKTSPVGTPTKELYH